MLKVLAKKPDYPPGKKFAYSNVGSTIAAAMAEKKTGDTWEDLVKREVFEPLALDQRRLRPAQEPGRNASPATRSPTLPRGKIRG